MELQKIGRVLITKILFNKTNLEELITILRTHVVLLVAHLTSSGYSSVLF